MIKLRHTTTLSKVVQYHKRNTSMLMSPALTIEDMPHPKGLPIIGTKLDLLMAGSGIRLHQFINDRHTQLGHIFYEKLGGSTKLVFISDPNLMRSLFMNLEGKYPTHLLPDPWVLYEKIYGCKRGLFFMNGTEWLTNRQIMNKHLLKENSEGWLDVPIKSTVSNFITNWKSKSCSGEMILPNLEDELYKLSTDVIISILLGKETTLKKTKYFDELLIMFSDSVKKIFQTTTKLYGMPVEWCYRLNLKVWNDFQECVYSSISLAQKIVSEMLWKRDENKGLIKKLCEDNVTDEVITKIVADFIMAAGDTTAYTTLWTLHELSQRQSTIEEIRANDKPYVKNVLKEIMRLYPVAPFLTRILPKQSKLDNYLVEAGTPIIASIYTSGRDENNFSKAEQFLPYRWDRKDERKNELTNHVPSASLPFALGARSCIGKKIAMIQMTEMIYQIINNFDLVNLTKNKVKPITSQVLIPDQEIKIGFSLRDKH